MACFRLDEIEPHEERDRLVRILNFKHNADKDFTSYIIKITIGDHWWTVERRYSEFDEFDKRRFRKSVNKQNSFFPPKKYIGNQDESFLAERRAELERYLRTVVELELWLQKKHGNPSIPQTLAKFLDFHKYEIHAICENLAERLAKKGDEWLQASTSKPKYFEFTPVELYAITQRLQLPEPTSTSNSTYDLAHIVDFLSRVHHLKIRGSKHTLGSSNIQVNSQPFCLSACKQVKSLWIRDCNAKLMQGFGRLKETVKCLSVHYSIENLSDLLSDRLDTPVPVPVSQMEIWSEVVEADFSMNELKEIDESVILLKRVHKLDLSHNSLNDIGAYLQHLTNLTELDLSNNGLETLAMWHARLGNVKKLKLKANSIRSLKGLSKLYSLEYLDVRQNALVQVTDVWPVGSLPCIHTILLDQNQVQSVVEYRTRVLEAFGERANEIYLDNDRPCQRELDMVGVRLAIRKAKEEKEQLLEKTRLQIGEKLRMLTDDHNYPSATTARESSS